MTEIVMQMEQISTIQAQLFTTLLLALLMESHGGILLILW